MIAKLKDLDTCMYYGGPGSIVPSMYRFFGKDVLLTKADYYDSDVYQYRLWDPMENIYWYIAKEWIDNGYKMEYNDIDNLFKEPI
jgi:hypothetical protein